jgi:hypothetical protein
MRTGLSRGSARRLVRQPMITSNIRSSRESPESRRDASARAASPRLVRVGEPNQLGVERAHQLLAFGVRFVELAEPDRHVAADDDWIPATPDDDHLRAGGVARRRRQLNDGERG